MKAWQKPRASGPTSSLWTFSFHFLDGYEAVRQIKANPELAMDAHHHRQLVCHEG